MAAAKTNDPDAILAHWIERDLTSAAEAGELLPAFEIDDVIRRVTDVVGAGRQPILGGESGIGKSAVVHELVRRVVAGGGPSALQGKRVVQISLRTRMSGLQKPEQMKPEMQKLCTALVARKDKVVAFIRDLHLAYEYDLEPMLETLGMRFAQGHGVVIGEGDGQILNSMIEHTPALDQYYVALPLREPDLPTMERILAAWCEAQAEKGKRFDAAAQKQALQLAHRFLARTRMPRKVLDFLGQVGSLVEGDRVVGEGDVIDRFHQSYRVPRFLIDPSIGFDVDATERSFRSRVLGQPDAVRTVVRMIALIKAGLSDPRRPFGAFLFVGPTGVGKTHIAQLLAEFLFGSRDRMVRLNMADYPNMPDANTLFGYAEGYTPRQRRGLLTMRTMGHPFAVLLLDEFEKAHEKVHDRFLQLMDEGAFINGAGETVPCRSMIIIATSNAGAEVYRRQPLGFAPKSDLDQLDKELDRILHRTFRIEFLNRFDQIVHFHPLTRDDIRIIALREVEHLRDRAGLQARGLTLEVDEAILDWLTAHGYDPHFGARFLRRTIERTVTTAVAEVVVRESLEKGTRIGLGIRGSQVVARVVERPTDKEKAKEKSSKASTVRLPMGTTEQVRSMDRRALHAEADAILLRAAPLLDALQRRREDASKVLAEMNAEGFWDDKAAAQQTLDRYRALDVAVQVGDRHAQSIRALEDARKSGISGDPLARAVERAAKAIQRWEERTVEEGPSAAWIVLRNADPLENAASFLEELVEMELAWCARLHLAAEVVAYGHVGAGSAASGDDQLARVVIEAEGPGAAAYLSMERGVHRLHRADRGGDLRVRIDVVPRGDSSDGASRVTRIRPRSGAFDLEVMHAVRVETDRGLSMELVGAHARTLERLAIDLEANVAQLTAVADPARLYAQGGVGARDPRTNATLARFKDAMRGRLDALLEAWRRAGYGRSIATNEATAE